MVGRFAGRNAAVVAIKTAAGNTCVVVYGIAKGDGVVTVVARVARRWVIGRFARRNAAIVATGTAANDFKMIHSGNYGKAGSVVAGFTVV